MVAAPSSRPTRELKSFVAEHPEWFRDEPRFGFDQVYRLRERAGFREPEALELCCRA